MKRILFVDDESKLLEGLRRMLRGMRHEWEMEFAEGGHAALELMGQKAFNVVVTDMRMPGMDGCQLLSRVKELYPQVVRIVLSGHTEREMAMEAAILAHQYLSKPCDADTLKNTVSRCCSLRRLLDNDSLIRVVSGLTNLPSLPSLYTEVIKEIDSPDGSLNRVGEIISQDTGMSAKILQLVNSAFFGHSRHVASPVRAVNLLGLETVKALILTIKIFCQYEQSNLPGFSMDAQWEHSMSTGLYAKQIAIAEDLGQDKIDEAFISGLLHDIGKLILLDRFPEKCLQILEEARSANCSLWEAEQHVIGTTHAEIGAYLLGIWGLSEPIVNAVAFHHYPIGLPHESLDTLTIVHVANTFVQRRSSKKDQDSQPGLDTAYLDRLHVEDRVEVWRKVCDLSYQGEANAG